MLIFLGQNIFGCNLVFFIFIRYVIACNFKINYYHKHPVVFTKEKTWAK